MLDSTPYHGPLLVTVACVLVYYGFIVQVARVKYRLAQSYQARGEKFDRYFGMDREMLAADRIHLNMLEQMPPFLVLLWLNAVFVGATSTTIAGGIWVAARLLYPFVMGSRLGRGLRAAILLSTVPGYLVIFWFTGALIARLVAAS